MSGGFRASDVTTLVVTAQFAKEAQRRFDSLRQEHFPAGRNKVPAHVSLFHTLPARLLGDLTDDARRMLPDLTPEVWLTGIRFLGRGVAYAVDAPGLGRLRAVLADKHAPLLTPQDRQGFRPHVTIQNKADPGAARLLADQLAAVFVPERLAFANVVAWFYRDGAWERAATVPWHPTSDTRQ